MEDFSIDLLRSSNVGVGFSTEVFGMDANLEPLGNSYLCGAVIYGAIILSFLHFLI